MALSLGQPAAETAGQATDYHREQKQ